MRHKTGIAVALRGTIPLLPVPYICIHTDVDCGSFDTFGRERTHSGMFSMRNHCHLMRDISMRFLITVALRCVRRDWGGGAKVGVRLGAKL